MWIGDSMLGKVKFHGAGGYPFEQSEARGILNIDEEYEVERVNVGSFHSTYKLVGYDKEFNTVLFEDSPIFDNAVKQWWTNYYDKS